MISSSLSRGSEHSFPEKSKEPGRSAKTVRAMSKGKLLFGVIICASLAAVPALAGPYFGFVVGLALINCVAATGINISMGYAGLVSVGHAGFAAIGAYATVLLMTHLGVSYFLAILLASAIAATCGIIIAIPSLRLSSLYIAMITFGFGQAVNLVLMNWLELTRGPNGLAVPPIQVFGHEVQPVLMYYFLIGAFLCALWISWNLLSSRFGRALLALKGNEAAAESMGIPVARYKIAAFALGALFGGLSGSLYVGVSDFINPYAFSFEVSIAYLTMSVVGGLGVFWGPVFGASLLTVLPELLRPVAEYKELVFGSLLLIFLIVMPEGIAPMIGRGVGRLRR